MRNNRKTGGRKIRQNETEAGELEDWKDKIAIEDLEEWNDEITAEELEEWKDEITAEELENWKDEIAAEELENWKDEIAADELEKRKNETETEDTEKWKDETETGDTKTRWEEARQDMPFLKEIEAELNTVKHKNRYRRTLRSTVCILVIMAAAVLIAVLLLPVLRITSSSMTETLHDGDIVVALSGSDFQTGDVVAFYYNNNILVKRVIAAAGDWVDIDDEGNVFVNEVRLEEPYISEKSLGDCNIKHPCQVPDGSIFVMGDHRETSVDSRNTAVGCIKADLTIGKVIFRVWPFSAAGMI